MTSPRLLSPRSDTARSAAEAWQPIADSTDPWFRRYPVEYPVARLVCLPHAGGTAGMFHGWPPSLAPGIEMLAVRYPGRQDRLDDPLPQSLEDLADEIAGHLLPYLDLPVALFGHSMGSAVAHAVAQRVEDRSPGALARLFVSGRPAPADCPPDTAHLADDETLSGWATGLGGPGADLYTDPDLRSLLLSPLRDDLRLLNTYRPSQAVPLYAPVTAFGGTADPGCPPEDMFTWSKVTTGDFDMQSFDGDHFYLLSHAAALADAICSRLPR
ncbi:MULTISPECIES: thioesterase II family protein [unclassified Streptomyces]|uniref:thioesterase II family protein n=1 Tax=unclassified Streptomyces TaxID=2593676 RepID=UPI00381B0D56